MAASDANYQSKSSHFTSNLEVDPMISNRGMVASGIYLSPRVANSPQNAVNTASATLRKSKSGQKPANMQSAAVLAQSLAKGSKKRRENLQPIPNFIIKSEKKLVKRRN